MFSKHWFQCGLAVGASLLAVGAVAASAGNHYVTVGSDTVGVEEIVPVDDDFYVTTRGVGAPDFIADISVSPNFSWRLVYPSSGKLELGIGASDLYEVEDSTGSEDSAGGRIEVLKLDIAPSETNICWKSSGVTLSLTPDSALGGGTATWSSEPTGISGSGTSIAVNPGSLAPGEYVVTAASTIVPSYADTCVVRIIKVDIVPDTTNFCWNATSALLSLTPDGYLGGGTANWTSDPVGVSGSGTSITFNPSGLTPGAYVVTVTKGMIHGFSPSPEGASAGEHFCFIQKFRGTVLKDGVFATVKMYGTNIVTLNSSTWRFDSANDKDPVYNSEESSYGHTALGDNTFSVPDETTMGYILGQAGECSLEFETGVYCRRCVPTTGADQPVSSVDIGAPFSVATWDACYSVDTNGIVTFH